MPLFYDDYSLRSDSMNHMSLYLFCTIHHVSGRPLAALVDSVVKLCENAGYCLEVTQPGANEFSTRKHTYKRIRL